MTDLGTGERLQLRVSREPEFVNRVMWVAGVLGLGAAVAGVIIGFATGLHSVTVACADGQVSTGSGDPTCHSYPQAGIGTSIALISAVAGVLVILACIAVTLLVALRREHERVLRDRR